MRAVLLIGLLVACFDLLDGGNIGAPRRTTAPSRVMVTIGKPKMTGGNRQPVDDGDGNKGGAAASVSDTDRDGIPNDKDTDDDNDGIPDDQDKDDDNDGIPDDQDNDNDNDNDGIPDDQDKDDDNDGIPDDQDNDDDNDGIPDDQDNDNDKDGILDGQDPDDDNDGIPDEKDPDDDNDGIPDDKDPDDDNDGVPDEQDKDSNRYKAGGKDKDDDGKKDDDTDGEDDEDEDDDDEVKTTAAVAYVSTTDDDDGPACSEPAFLSFPTDLFRVTNNPGLVWIHILVTIYLFLAIAVICDEYFCPSLDVTANKMGLSEDVAGATLMSFGSSAPELFISIIAVFVGSTDVGTGTIVGSAVFNILFVIGICGILVSKPCRLSWWPFIRDSFCYILTVLVLLLLMIDNRITWWESAFMLLLYCLYILLMKYNDAAHAFFVSKFAICIKKDEGEAFDNDNYDSNNKTDGYASFAVDGVARPGITNNTNNNNGYNAALNNSHNGNYPFAQAPANGSSAYYSVANDGNVGAVLMVDEEISYGRYALKLSFEDACWRFMITWQFRPISRFRAAAYIIMFERRKLMQYPEFSSKYRQLGHLARGGSSYAVKKSIIDPAATQAWRIAPPQGFNRPYISWLLCYPIRLVTYYTIVDCRLQQYERYYAATFGLSVLWISIISYILVWVVTSIGYVFGIPDAVMGITLLAAGTSISDCVSSVIVARKGYGDMAVSNSFGSNVFDILVGLGFPWFIQTALVDPGTTVSINSRGLLYDAILLFAAIFGTLLMIYMCEWRLNKKLGYVSMGVYAVFLIFSLMIEFNLLGFVNPPMCLV